MNISSTRSWVNRNETVVIVFAAFAIAMSLFTVEFTGIPASVRSDPMYGSNVLQHQSAGDADVVDERDYYFRERLCERVVNRFADDKNAWDRVIERIQKRFGFLCSL